MLGVQRALQAETRKLRRTVAKAASAAAEGMSVAGADWSDRRKRLVEWQASLLKKAIPMDAFESRPVTRELRPRAP